MNSTTISTHIMQWIKLQLTRLGASEKWLDRLEPFIYIIIIALIAFIIAEIVFRITQLMLKRFLRLRSYTFLKKLLEHNALRKQTHIIPPLIMQTLLPLAFGDNPTLLFYVDKFVWLYFIFMLTGAINSLITVIGETAFNNTRYHNRPIKGFIQIAKIIVYIFMTIIVISISLSFFVIDLKFFFHNTCNCLIVVCVVNNNWCCIANKNKNCNYKKKYTKFF